MKLAAWEMRKNTKIRSKVFCASAALLLFSMHSAAAGWESMTSADNLDQSKKSVQVFSKAEPFQQSGSLVSTFLVVHCSTTYKPSKLVPTLEFSSPVAIGERTFRWRVDEKPIRSMRSRLMRDGTIWYLAERLEYAVTIAELRSGKKLRVEADLP